MWLVCRAEVWLLGADARALPNSANGTVLPTRN